MTAKIIPLSSSQREVLMTLTFARQPMLLPALCSALKKQGSNTMDMNLYIQRLLSYGLIEQDASGAYRLTIAGLAHLIWYQIDDDFDVGRVMLALDAGLTPGIEVMMVCLGYRWLLREAMSPAASNLLSRLCESPLIWVLIDRLPVNEAESLLPEVWFRHILRQPYPRWGQAATEELSLWESDLLALDWEADLHWLDGAAGPHGNHVLSETLTQSVVSELPWIQKAARTRGVVQKWGVGSLIELAVVALFDLPRAQSHARQLSQAMSQFADPALLPSWYHYLTLLTGDVATLEDYFADLVGWCERLAGEDVPWGQLYLEVLAACRLIDARPEMQHRFAEALRGPTIERILAAEAAYPLARQAVAGLRHLQGAPEARPFRHAVPVWEQWLNGLTQLVDQSPSAAQRTERLVWQLTACRSHVVAKIQKRGKKGWSKGRQVQIDDLGYRYAELVSDHDQGVIGAIQNRYGRAWRSWQAETELNVPLLRTLVKCDNIVDETGSDLTLYAEKPLVVLSEEDERLVVSSFPAQGEQLLYSKASDALAFLDISDQVSSFMAAVREHPQSLPVAA